MWLAKVIILNIIGFTLWNSLVETHGCVCPQDRLSYKCSVAGVEPRVGTTAWRGSALAVLCSQGGGEIVLHHRSFNETRNCGNIVVRGIQEDNSCYTSQLNVTVDPSLDNKTVECFYSNGTTTTVIGTSSIEITKGMVQSYYNMVSVHSP